MTSCHKPGKDKIQATIHVAPSGNDAHPGTEHAPFQTLERARQAVREINANMTGDIVVRLQGGRYLLDKPFALEARDSGTNGHAVIYAAAPGEPAILDGGTRIDGWKRGEHDTWVAEVNLDAMRQLYVNGKRALRSMMFGQLLGHLELLENGRGYRTASEIAAWLVGAEGVEFVYRWTWTHTRLRVAEVRKNGSHYEILMKQPEFFLAQNKAGTQILDPLFMENFPPFPPAMQLPGVWYFDPKRKLLSYKPEVGEDVTQSEFIVPRLEKLLDIRGTPAEPVRKIRFQNLGFEHATWLEPNRTGLVDVQSTFQMTPETKLMVRPNTPVNAKVFLMPEAHECVKTPANVTCHAGHDLAFEGCRFAHLGGAGLDIERGSAGVRVTNCEFDDISGTGIQVADVQRDDHHPDDPRKGVRNVEIADCKLHHLGAEYRGSVGIFVGYAKQVKIARNEIHHLPYSGISVGWGWGELDAGDSALFGQAPSCFRFSEPALSGGHVIEKNHIHDVVLELDDGAAIYTLGRMPGTRISDNIIHDSRGWSGGIYLDAGSAELSVERNVIYRVLTPIVLAEGCEKTCLIKDNAYNVPPEIT